MPVAIPHWAMTVGCGQRRGRLMSAARARVLGIGSPHLKFEPALGHVALAADDPVGAAAVLADDLSSMALPIRSSWEVIQEYAA